MKCKSKCHRERLKGTKRSSGPNWLWWIATLALAMTTFFASTSFAMNDVYAILFILDGTPKNFLYGLINDGSLPVLKEYFWDDGAHANAVITTFPSASAPAYQSYITGLFAGRSGIPYLEWYDRNTQKEINYLGLDYRRASSDLWNLKAVQDPDIPDFQYPVTIFDKFGDEPTASIYSEIFKGAKYRHPKLPIKALSDVFITHSQEKLDIRAFHQVKKIFGQDESKIPRFTLVGLYSADVLQHAEGANTENAKFALMQFDRFLKEFIDLLKEKGLFDKTYIVVVSDHGMHDITHDVEVATPLAKNGFDVRSKDVFIGERGVASAHIYFRKNKEAGIDVLRKLEDLSLVISKRDLDHVDVYSKECHSVIRKIDISGKTFYGYSADSCDPLDYCNDTAIKKMCDGKVYDDRTWLERTWDKKYPDGVVQLGQIFDDGRAGDVFLVANNGGGFYKEKVATHGSLIAADMQVPMLIHGPNVPKGEFGPARTVDLYPTMTAWFGLQPEIDRDGVLLWSNGAMKRSDSETLQLARAVSFMLGRPPLIMSPNPDELKKEFQKLFPKVNEQALTNEIDRQNRLLKKYEIEFSQLKESDLKYPLISEQFKKSQKDIRRFEDVKALIRSEESGSFGR